MKLLIAAVSLMFMVGCASMPFFGSNDALLTEILVACQDFPVEDFDECLKAELAKRPDTDGITVGELHELLNTLHAEEVE